MALEISSVLILCENIPQCDNLPSVPKGSTGKVLDIHGDFVHVELPVGVVRVVERKRIHSNRSALYGYYLEASSAGLQNTTSDVVHVEEVSNSSQLPKPGETNN